MKMVSYILILVLLIPATGVMAANGDIAGQIYSTDILAYVNSKPVESYNIGGKTAIVMEDLGESYGFTVWYEDEGRKLTVNTTGQDSLGECMVERGTVGKILGNIYETDIKVVFNTKEVKGYNIGGRTAVCIEDLGTVTEESKNYEYGYSDYLCNFIWDENTRTVSLNTFKVQELFMAPKVRMWSKDNEVFLSFDQLEENYPDSSLSDEFLSNTYKIMPVFYNDEEIGLMYLDWKGREYSHLDKHVLYNESKELSVVLSYEEAVSYIEKNFNVLDTRENDKAKYFLAEKDERRYLLTAQKTKGLIARHTDENAVFTADENGETYLSYYGAGTPGSGTVNFHEYFMDDDLYDFDEYVKNYEASLTEEEIREINISLNK